MAAPFQDCIVLFGDSLTSRQEVPGSLQALFNENYRRTLDVLNRGYGGYNTDWVRPVFDRTFARKDEAAAAGAPAVRLVTIWLGANDSVLPGIDTNQHVPLSTYVSNLRHFLAQLTAPTSALAAAHTPGLNIVLATPPPLWRGMMADPAFRAQRDPAVSAGYAQAVRDLVDEFKGQETADGNWRIGLVDMWKGVLEAAGGDGPGLEPFFTDGLHLSTKGYAVFWDQYTRLLKTAFSGRGLDYADLSDLPMRVPDMSEVKDGGAASVVGKLRLPAIRQ